MNRPPLVNYAIGHPAVLILLVLILAVTVYRAWIGELSWIAAGLMVLVTSWSSRAFDRVTSYRRWKREWDAMAGDAPQHRAMPRWLRILGAMLVIGATAALLYHQRADPLAVLGMGWLVICLLAGGVVWLFKHWRTRRALHQQQEQAAPIVTIVPRGPMLEVPPLSVAYHRLPPHCHRALQHSGHSDDAR